MVIYFIKTLTYHCIKPSQRHLFPEIDLNKIYWIAEWSLMVNHLPISSISCCCKDSLFIVFCLNVPIEPLNDVPIIPPKQQKNGLESHFCRRSVGEHPKLLKRSLPKSHLEARSMAADERFTASSRKQIAHFVAFFFSVPNWRVVM